MTALRRLLFITHNFPPMAGGISTYSGELCRGFSCSGIDVHVLTCAEFHSSEMLTFQVHYFKELPFLGKARRCALWFSLLRVIDEVQPDAIFLASHHPYGFIVNTVSKRRHIPYAVGSHGSDILRITHHQVGYIARWMGKRTLQGASAIFSVSSFVADRVKSIAPLASEPVVIPNGLDQEVFSLGPKDLSLWSKVTGIELKGKFVLLSVSTLIAHKGHAVVLNALSRVRDQIPNLVYLIAGSGSEFTYLHELTEKLNLKPLVKFIGSVPHRDIPSLMRTADVLIQVSQREPGEGFGIVFLEANGCGLPVIGSNVGGIPEAVCDGETGLLVEPDSPQQIAVAILRLAQDENLRQAMGQAGRRWAEKHNWSLIIPRYLEKIENIVK